MPRKAKAPKPARAKSKYAAAKHFFGRAPKAQMRNNKIEVGKGSSSMIVGAPAVVRPEIINADA